MGARSTSQAVPDLSPAGNRSGVEWKTSGTRSAGYVGDVDGDGSTDFAIGDLDYMSGAGRVILMH